MLEEPSDTGSEEYESSTHRFKLVEDDLSDIPKLPDSIDQALTEDSLESSDRHSGPGSTIEKTEDDSVQSLDNDTEYFTVNWKADGTAEIDSKNRELSSLKSLSPLIEVKAETTESEDENQYAMENFHESVLKLRSKPKPVNEVAESTEADNTVEENNASAKLSDKSERDMNVNDEDNREAYCATSGLDTSCKECEDEGNGFVVS